MMKRLIILCLLSGCLLSGCDRIRGILGMATSADIERARKELEEKAVQQRLMDSLAALVPDTLQKQVPVPRADATLDKKYYVIVGSFKRDKNSEGMLAFLRKEGYEPLRIPLKNGYDMVALCGYDNYDSARAEVNKIERKEVCPYDVWIYDVNQKLHK